MSFEGNGLTFDCILTFLLDLWDFPCVIPPKIQDLESIEASLHYYNHDLFSSSSWFFFFETGVVLNANASAQHRFILQVTDILASRKLLEFSHLSAFIDLNL